MKKYKAEKFEILVEGDGWCKIVDKTTTPPNFSYGWTLEKLDALQALINVVIQEEEEGK